MPNDNNPPVQEHVFLIETEKISPNPYQPRKMFDPESLRELANSIREFGILQPLVVTKIEEANEFGATVRYELIAGERRLRASQQLGLERVPAIIKNTMLDQQRLEMAIVENVQRANLNPIESARAYNRLQDEFKLTQREIASRIGKSREVIANTMRLLNLPTEMQDAVGRNQLSESQARLLLSVEDLPQQQTFFNEILKSNLSVRDLKSKIDYYKSVKRSSTPSTEMPDAESAHIQKQLEELFGTQVKLEKSGETGKITIAFYSPQELQEILKKMTAKDEPQAPAGDSFHL